MNATPLDALNTFRIPVSSALLVRNAAALKTIRKTTITTKTKVICREERGSRLENYDGDFRCQVSEGGPCRKEATMVYREPFTPASVAVPACDEHSDGLSKAGYHFDEQATIELARDREREAMIGV
jgi:hypothetical protein